MGKLWDLIEAHMDAQQYRPSQADIARAMGLKSATTLTDWKNGRIYEMPQHKHLWAVVDVTGASIHRVLEAALIDAGYYERGEEHERSASTKVTDISTRRQPPPSKAAARRGKLEPKEPGTT